MTHVITITGPSGAGKSTTLRYLLECENSVFQPVPVPKSTTRPPHSSDWEKEVKCVSAIPEECDLVYEQYGARYGVALGSIFDHLVERRSPIVILNDIRAVEDVRDCWRGIVKSLFVFRRSPTLKQYQELARSREVSFEEESPEIRFQKAKELYRIYIENIHLFDHVILNSGTRDDLREQIRQIAQGFERDPNWPLR